MVNDEQGSNGGGEDDEEAYDVHEDHLAMAPILQGQLKKKQLKKAGKTVSVSAMLFKQHVHISRSILCSILIERAIFSR